MSTSNGLRKTLNVFKQSKQVIKRDFTVDELEKNWYKIRNMCGTYNRINGKYSKVLVQKNEPEIINFLLMLYERFPAFILKRFRYAYLPKKFEILISKDIIKSNWEGAVTDIKQDYSNNAAFESYSMALMEIVKEKFDDNELNDFIAEVSFRKFFRRVFMGDNKFNNFQYIFDRLRCTNSELVNYAEWALNYHHNDEGRIQLCSQIMQFLNEKNILTPELELRLETIVLQNLVYEKKREVKEQQLSSSRGGSRMGQLCAHGMMDIYLTSDTGIDRIPIVKIEFDDKREVIKEISIKNEPEAQRAFKFALADLRKKLGR